MEVKGELLLSRQLPLPSLCQQTLANLPGRSLVGRQPNIHRDVISGTVGEQVSARLTGWIHVIVELGGRLGGSALHVAEGCRIRKKSEKSVDISMLDLRETRHRPTDGMASHGAICADHLCGRHWGGGATHGRHTQSFCRENNRHHERDDGKCSDHLHQRRPRVFGCCRLKNLYVPTWQQVSRVQCSQS
jgi:hypothetical protein